MTKETLRCSPEVECVDMGVGQGRHGHGEGSWRLLGRGVKHRRQCGALGHTARQREFVTSKTTENSALYRDSKAPKPKASQFYISLLAVFVPFQDHHSTLSTPQPSQQQQQPVAPGRTATQHEIHQVFLCQW